MKNTSKKTPVQTLSIGLLTLIVGGASLAAEPTEEKVTWLGVAVSSVDESLRHHLKLPWAAGLTVNHVMPGSPAASAEVQEHDILCRLDEQLLFNADQLRSLVRGYEPGDGVDLLLVREGTELELGVTLGETEAPAKSATKAFEFKMGSGGPFAFKLDDSSEPLHYAIEALRKHRPGPHFAQFPPPRPGKPTAFLGIEVREIGEEVRAQLALDDGVGIMVGHVVEDSPAEQAGIRLHDVIVEIDEESIEGPRMFVEGIRERKKGDVVRLKLYRRGKPIEVEAELAERVTPKTVEWNELRHKFFVVPEVKILTAPEGGGDSTIILRRTNTPDGAGDFAPGLVSSGERRIILRTADDVDRDFAAAPIREPGSKTRETTTRVVRVEDGKRSIFLRASDGDRRLTILDAEGNKVFDGPANADADLQGAPARAQRTDRED